MSESINRRAALRQGLRGAVRGVSEARRQAGPIGDLLSSGPPSAANGAEPVLPASPWTVPGEPTTRVVSLQELENGARCHGLETRIEEVRALARISGRATDAEPGSVPVPSQLGGTPPIGDGPRPVHEGAPIPFIGQFQMPGDEDGAGGLIAVFVTPGDRVGSHPVASVLWRPLADAGDQAPQTGGSRLRVTHELQLPRAWSAAVRALGLSADEREAWEELRGWLAEQQGVEPFDRQSRLLGLHRVLGYPDERSGDLPLLCEMRSAGALDVRRSPRSQDGWRDHEEASARWRLLLQVTRDAASGEHFSHGEHRLYLFITEDDLAHRDYTRVEAVFR